MWKTFGWVFTWCSLDSAAPPSELLEMCEQSLDEMGAIFDDSNVYMLHMMYQAMGVCIYMQDADGAIRYGQKILKPYRYRDSSFVWSFIVSGAILIKYFKTLQTQRFVINETSIGLIYLARARLTFTEYINAFLYVFQPTWGSLDLTTKKTYLK